jgi:hypothetical protein
MESFIFNGLIPAHNLVLIAKHLLEMHDFLITRKKAAIDEINFYFEETAAVHRIEIKCSYNEEKDGDIDSGQEGQGQTLPAVS